MPATLADVAAHIGLSLPTVACILRGDDARFREATIKRVQRAANELGYRPNTSARAMATGRFDMVGMLVPASRMQWRNAPPPQQAGILATLRRHRCRLLICEVPDESAGALSQELPHLLREWSTDGLLLDATASPALTAAVEALAIPAIWINSLLPANCVLPDDAGAGAVAARHLLALGHRTLGVAGRAFVMPAGQRHHSADARWSGAVAACAEFRAVCHGPYAFAPAKELDSGCALLRAQPTVTAWIACGGQEAANLYVAAMRLGLRVPEDVSIIAIDANPDAWIGTPFTTVELDWGGVGRQAAEDLITRRDSGGTATPARIMGTMLTLGTTTGAPRSA